MKKQPKTRTPPPKKELQPDFFPKSHWDSLGHIQRLLLLEQIHRREKAGCIAVARDQFSALPAKLQNKIIDYFESADKAIEFFDVRAFSQGGEL